VSHPFYYINTDVKTIWHNGQTHHFAQ